MSRQVWKFGPIGYGWTPVEIPSEWKFGHFGAQRGDFYFWAEVNPKALATKRRFIVMPTGCDVPLDGIYRGTYVDEKSLTVWHLYERL